jgi:hypothetical protein
MRQDAGDRHEPPEPAPEPFDVFYRVAQVDAAGRLREIMRHSRRPVAHGRTPTLPEQPPEPPGPPPPLLRPPAWPRRTPQRLALVVNLLLVLGLGVVLGVAATDRQDANGGAPVPAASTVAVTRPAIQAKVPDACVDSVELADEVISRLNRNIRDNRLAETLRAYTIASQACRRVASP